MQVLLDSFDKNKGARTPLICLRKDIVLNFRVFVVVHQQLLDTLAIRLVEAFGGEFTADGLDSDVRSDEVLVNHYPTDKTESQRVLVHTNKDAVSLTDRDDLFIGVDFDIPRS